jgi:hypothetical protein
MHKANPHSAIKIDDMSETRETIPPEIVNVMPSIFIPLEYDITNPRDLPQDRFQKLDRILKSIDFHRQGVRQNLIAMFASQVKRVQMLYARQEQAQGISEGKASVSSDEVDRLIAAMETPAVPGVDYNVAILPPMDLSQPPPDDFSGRDKAAWEVLREIEKAMSQLDGFAAHMDGVALPYLDRLAREVNSFNGAD